MEYTVTMYDGSGASETITIDAEDAVEAQYIAESETTDWIKGGDWGSDGALVSASWELYDSDDDLISRDTVDVEIEPDHVAMIIRAGGSVDCDHAWTSEGEGGCDENPGVWSTGGTSMVFVSHCRACGLRRTERHVGSQHNPGERDTTSYSQPESWCEACESEECESPPQLIRLYVPLATGVMMNGVLHSDKATVFDEPYYESQDEAEAELAEDASLTGHDPYKTYSIVEVVFETPNHWDDLDDDEKEVMLREFARDVDENSGCLVGDYTGDDFGEDEEE